MKKVGKKIIALLMSLFITFGTVPSSALAGNNSGSSTFSAAGAVPSFGVEVIVQEGLDIPSPLYLVFKQSNVHVQVSEQDGYDSDQYFYIQLENKSTQEISTSTFTTIGRTAENPYDVSYDVSVYLAKAKTNGGYIYSVGTLANPNEIEEYTESILIGEQSYTVSYSNGILSIGDVAPVECSMSVSVADDVPDLSEKRFYVIASHDSNDYGFAHITDDSDALEFTTVISKLNSAFAGAFASSTFFVTFK